MSNSFNEPGNCLIFANLTDYGKTAIRHVDNKKVECWLVEQMFDPREGIVYQTGEEFRIIVDSPMMHEISAYDHGWVMVKIYTGHGDGRGAWKVRYIVMTMLYVTPEDRLALIRLLDVPVLVVILQRCVQVFKRESKTVINYSSFFK